MRQEGDKGLCLECADLSHLEFLPRGTAVVTLRAGKYSTLKAVVVRWSNARKRYERQGILAEPAAIRRAELEADEDADVRAKRREQAAQVREVEDREFLAAFARAIGEAFPACPPGEADAIAAHACLKHSGRVGRSAAAKELDGDAVRLAVTSHARHQYTRYDELLMAGTSREAAREAVRAEIERVQRVWRQPP